MPVKTISTFNAATQAVGAGTSLIISANSLPTIQSLKGYCNGVANTQYWLQFFNSATVPVNTTVPLLSLQVLGVDGFVFNDKPVGFDSAQLAPGQSLVVANGLICCLSTTEATLTIGTGNVTMDLAVDIDSGDVPVLSQTQVKGTGVASLTVVADPSTNKLVRFSATNTSGATAYLQLFGYATPATGAYPVEQMTWTVAAGATITPELGNGFFVLQGDANYVIHTGIYLYGSTTKQTFTASGAVWNITAYYI